jgi:hypothetical protein
MHQILRNELKYIHTWYSLCTKCTWFWTTPPDVHMYIHTYVCSRLIQDFSSPQKKSSRVSVFFQPWHHLTFTPDPQKCFKPFSNCHRKTCRRPATHSQQKFVKWNFFFHFKTREELVRVRDVQDSFHKRHFHENKCFVRQSNDKCKI